MMIRYARYAKDDRQRKFRAFVNHRSGGFPGQVSLVVAILSILWRVTRDVTVHGLLLQKTHFYNARQQSRHARLDRSFLCCLHASASSNIHLESTILPCLETSQQQAVTITALVAKNQTRQHHHSHASHSSSTATARGGRRLCTTQNAITRSESSYQRFASQHQSRYGRNRQQQQQQQQQKFHSQARYQPRWARPANTSRVASWNTTVASQVRSDRSHWVGNTHFSRSRGATKYMPTTLPSLLEIWNSNDDDDDDDKRKHGRSDAKINVTDHRSIVSANRGSSAGKGELQDAPMSSTSVAAARVIEPSEAPIGKTSLVSRTDKVASQRGQLVTRQAAPVLAQDINNKELGNGTRCTAAPSVKVQSDAAKRPISQARAMKSEPWKASYHTSLISQEMIKNSVINGRETSRKRPTTSTTAVQRAFAVLETLFSIPPEECNASNLVCALTMSAKLIERNSDERFRALFFRAVDVLHLLLATPRALSARQLCNVVWAIAKHYDRDAGLLPARSENTAMSSNSVLGHAEKWDLRNDMAGCPRQRVNEAVDEVARQISAILDKDGESIKEVELCMASWAFGILRRRRRPPGWQQGPQISQFSQTRDAESFDSDFLKFEQWHASGNPSRSKEPDIPTLTDDLFDGIAAALSPPAATPKGSDGAVVDSSRRLKVCKWIELANLAWAFASHGRARSDASVQLLTGIAIESTRRLREGGAESRKALSRDLAQIIWALGALQSDNFHLAASLAELVEAVASVHLQNGRSRPFQDWSCADLVQMIHALAHARLDNQVLLHHVFSEALERLDAQYDELVLTSERRMFFRAWELSILLWAQARLHLTIDQGMIFQKFSYQAILKLNQLLRETKDLDSIGIGEQEKSNIAWSITVLQLYESSSALNLLQRIYSEAAESCRRDGLIQLEHAHQLWQALYVLEEEWPRSVQSVQSWFRSLLKEKWLIEKARLKLSSARHRSLSRTLQLMGVAHYNEHDEDIDVAIVLKPQASWTHQTGRAVGDQGMRVAVEFDGPNHFTRQLDTKDGSGQGGPRALGHTVLKYRLLKRQGWTVIRVPYYEFDKIPFWASMERQRYVQRLLKTHANIRFSSSDVSVYKAQVSNRQSRFD